MLARWEYLTCFLQADTSLPEAHMATLAEDLPRNSPKAMIPQLNELGAKGWELVHMQPVFAGRNEDVLMLEGGGLKRWTSTYFCVFKRPQ